MRTGAPNAFARHPRRAGRSRQALRPAGRSFLLPVTVENFQLRRRLELIAEVLAAGFGCGAGRRTSIAGLFSRRPSQTTWRSRLSPVQVRYFTSATSSGPTQCTRLRTSGEPKRLLRGGGTSALPRHRGRGAMADVPKKSGCSSSRRGRCPPQHEDHFDVERCGLRWERCIFVKANDRSRRRKER